MHIPGQDVIATVTEFRMRQQREKYQDVDVEQQLADVLDRQRLLSELEVAIAELLYRARAVFIGGQCLPFGLLSPMKQREYVREAKRLIQERD